MNTSFTEENYLKTIFKLSEQTSGNVSTNAIADALQTKASSVTDMIKKLGEKNLLDHTRYQGVSLTEKGREKALGIVRRHRLWEVFLVKNLEIGWEEVHDIAEQLEHTNSEKLYEQLDKFLNFPRYDPHGDPIPDKEGKMQAASEISISDLTAGEEVTVQGIVDHQPDFLQFLDQINLIPGAKLKVIKKLEFDGSVNIETNKGNEVMISAYVAGNVLVKR
jgi:DtxR family transcriptional regulator, Mn-dependent transcriptional regulator